MKKYKVVAVYYSSCTAEVEAESEDHAYELAQEMDGASFTDSGQNHDWHINHVEEIK